jgi:hypothetical protein
LDWTEISNGDTLAFPDTVADGEAGQSKTLTISVLNTGGADLNLTADPAVTGVGTEVWTLDLSEFVETLPTAESFDMDLRFDPFTCDDYAAVLTIESDDADENPFIIELEGAGIDGTPPVPGGGGVIDPAEDTITATSVSLSWTAATDNCSWPIDLRYRLVRSDSNNISTVTEAIENGTVVMDWTSDVTAVDVSSLSPAHDYWFNVLVEDELWNRAAYTPVVVTTLQQIFVFPTAPSFGNLGGSRATGDNACRTIRDSTYPGLPDDHVLMLISFDGDEMIDMASAYSIPTNRPFSGPGGTVFADNWADLFDGSIDMTLAAAGALGSGFWWSGSYSDGTGYTDTCENWYSAAAAYSGAIGSATAVDGNWILFGTQTCSMTVPFLCLAWE